MIATHQLRRLSGKIECEYNGTLSYSMPPISMITMLMLVLAPHQHQNHQQSQHQYHFERYPLDAFSIYRRRHKVNHRHFSFESAAALKFVANKVMFLQGDIENMLHHGNRINLSNFTFNFDGFSNRGCLSLLRFEKEHIVQVMDVTGWPVTQTTTKHNRYVVNAMLIFCIILRILAISSRWMDLEKIFGKHSSYLSEICWRTLSSSRQR